MKTYIDFTEKNVIVIDTLSIPKIHSNKHYANFLNELERGEAELIPFVAPALTWQQIRSRRDALLKDCDWTATVDANPKPSKEAWLTYRQALRDMPQDFTTPDESVWPTTPQ